MPANNFLFDTREIKFVFKEWLDMDRLLSFPAYKDYYSKEDIDSFIDVAFKIARDVMAPANEDADKIGAQFVDGKVITPPSFKTAYKTVMEAGLGPQIADRETEGRLPYCINAALLEMLTAGSASVVTYWGLTGGAASLIQEYGSEEQKAKFLPKMLSGEWGGTMNLTEPQAGSDVGAVATKAYPTSTPGVYKIKGTKIFISSGDHDICENFVHLVLARIEGAREGTAGLSLFIVPKYRVNDDGTLGPWNDVTTVGIEHKLGLKGSATCTLAYGDNDDCYGYLIGEPPGPDGKGQGMAQMFHMMNEARMGTGLLALAVAAEAYYNALAYARERVQGNKLTDPKGPRARIIEHEDVRRMLLLQKSCLEAIRAMIMKTYWYIDVAADSPDEKEREFAQDMVEISTPLCKAYASDMAWPLIGEAIQTYGGYGFIEEYPVAQLARDCKIYSIWEGTNYIQSMDLVGRKFTLNKGRSLMNLLGVIGQTIEKNKNHEKLAKEVAILNEAFQDYQAILGMLRGFVKQGKISMMPLFSTRILHATSMLYAGALILDQAVLAQSKLDELGESHYDAPFYQGKVGSAKFYINNIVPQVSLIKKVMEIADTSALDLPEPAFGSI